MIKILTKKTTITYGVIIYSEGGVLKMRLITTPTAIDPSMYDGKFCVYLMEV